MSYPSISTETLKTMKLLYALSKEEKPREIRALLNLFKNELRDVGLMKNRKQYIPFIKFRKNSIPNEYINTISQRVQYTHIKCNIRDNEKEFYVPTSNFDDNYVRVGINININLLCNVPEGFPFHSDKNGLCLIGSNLFLMPLANETYVVRDSKLYYSKNKKYIYLHPECDKDIFIYSVPV